MMQYNGEDDPCDVVCFGPATLTSQTENPTKYHESLLMFPDPAETNEVSSESQSK